MMAARRPGLRWRLTVSYALVTLVAALTVAAVAAARQAARGTVDADRAGPAQVLQKSAGAAAPYLSGPAPDPDAVRFWVVIPVVDELTRAGGRPRAVAVLGADGRLIAADSCTRSAHSATTAAGCRASAEAVVAARPAGSDGLLTAAIPGSGATLVAAFDGPVPAAAPPGAAERWSAGWSPDWVPLLLLAILLGTAAGLALSHRLVHRLRAMAGTVRVWSRGDLGAEVDTRGTDEVAALAVDLNAMAEQLRNLLAARREIARLEERHRVRRELHDGVKQELLAATLQLATARAALGTAPDAVPGHLDRAHESTRRAQRELTALIEQLRPSPLGFPDALAALCETFTAETGLPVDADLTAGLTAGSLPAEVEDALFRIAQEALTNVRRHANATRVTVTLHAGPAGLRLRVADDGTGPPPTPAPAGLGLTGMRERAEAIGAEFSIRDAGPGTAIEVIVPG